MNKKIRTIFFLIGLSFFVYLIYQFGLEKILENIQRTGWWFLPVIGIWGLVYFINTIVWYFIVDARSNELRFGNIFQITVSGFAINYITPFVNLGGEPYRVAALKDSIGLTKSISSVFLYATLHFMSHFIFWIIAIVAAVFTFSFSSSVEIILFVLLFSLIAFTVFTLRRQKKGIAQVFFKYLSSFPGIRKLQTKMEAKNTYMPDIDKEITGFYRNRKIAFYASLGLDLLSRFVAMFEFYFILKAIGINASISDAFYIAAGSSLIMNLFFFIPLTLGVREGGLFIIMQLLNFTPGVGVYVSVVNRIREFFWIFIGLILMQIFRNSPEKHYSTE